MENVSFIAGPFDRCGNLVASTVLNLIEVRVERAWVSLFFPVFPECWGVDIIFHIKGLYPLLCHSSISDISPALTLRAPSLANSPVVSLFFCLDVISDLQSS